MKQAIRFRVLIDTNEEQDVFRDIEVKKDQTFEDLHHFIQSSFNFDNSQMASFYESDNSWEHGDEISLMDMHMGDDKKEIRLMSTTLLSDVVKEQEQKILYVFDFLLMWTFFIEVVSFEEVIEGEEYPRLILSYGDAPDQYSKEPEDLFGAMGSDFNPDTGNGSDTEDDDPFAEFNP